MRRTGLARCISGSHHIQATPAGPAETGVYRSESESSTGQICLDGLFFLKTACQKGAGNTGEEIDARLHFLTEVRSLAG